MHELLQAACLHALALQLPPLCPRRWEEANGEGDSRRSPGGLRGRLGTWEPWHHTRQAGAPSWGSGNRGPRRQRGGAEMC